jgi:hypothetical protein
MLDGGFLHVFMRGFSAAILCLFIFSSTFVSTRAQGSCRDTSRLNALQADLSVAPDLMWLSNGLQVASLCAFEVPDGSSDAIIVDIVVVVNRTDFPQTPYGQMELVDSSNRRYQSYAVLSPTAYHLLFSRLQNRAELLAGVPVSSENDDVQPGDAVAVLVLFSVPNRTTNLQLAATTERTVVPMGQTATIRTLGRTVEVTIVDVARSPGTGRDEETLAAKVRVTYVDGRPGDTYVVDTVREYELRDDNGIAGRRQFTFPQQPRLGQTGSSSLNRGQSTEGWVAWTVNQGSHNYLIFGRSSDDKVYFDTR